ncbi:MAG: rhomboid family intramembrane serine protease [Anaerolineae bacterium]|nr:rhomboid family intramembrane serine protease [Anaerolineae bacterium]
MIPIGDVNPRRRTPIVTILIIALNVVVFLYQVLLPEREMEQFILQAGMIPYEVTQQWGLSAATSLLTSMFLHGSLMHILSNMLYLWIFGDNVEDCLGPLGFLVFYLVSGLIAAFAQIAVYPTSRIPTIGASGAVAGVLGAYIVLFPHTRVRTLVFVFRFIRFVEVPALIVLGLWFVLQLFSGVMALGAVASGGVAWFAHIGGFVAGLAGGWLCRRRGGASASRMIRY